MAIYNNLENSRKLSTASLTSIIDITNLNFTSFSDAVLEFLNNIKYDEVNNTMALAKGTFNFIDITNKLSLVSNGMPMFTIDSQGRAEGQSLLVKVAEAKRYRHTDFPDWPEIGVPGEIIYTGIQNQKPEFGEDFIGYLDGRGWVSLTGEGGGPFNGNYLTLPTYNIGSPPIPPTPTPGNGIIWIGAPGYQTDISPNTQTVYFTDENGDIFDLITLFNTGNFSYAETRSFTSMVTETISHNLGTKDIHVQLVDTITNELISSIVNNYQTNSVDVTLSSTKPDIRIIILSKGGSGSGGGGAVPITNTYIPKGTGTSITDGSWAFSGTTIFPLVDTSNIGTPTNRVGTIYFSSILDFETNLQFVFNGANQVLELTVDTFQLGNNVLGKYAVQPDTLAGWDDLSIPTKKYVDDNAGGSNLFTNDIVVSLSGGKTLGKYVNGDTIPSAGKTPEQVMNLIAIEEIAPTYVVATMSLTDTLPNISEVGTPYALNTLTATFGQNDAGVLTAIRIQKNGSDILPNGVSSPFAKTDSGAYVLGNITYQAFSNYNAGIIKNYTPSGTPDARTPAIRSVNAPQAAENNFGSNIVTLTGYYAEFYGPTAAAPINSATVRALPGYRLTNAGNTFTLATGAVEKIFAICLPPGKTLIQVLDTDALNANITGNFILTTFTVNDAGGNPLTYNIYIMTNAVPYASNHNFAVTTN